MPCIKYKDIKIKGRKVFAGNAPLISFTSGISPQERKYFEEIMMEAAMAVNHNEYAKVYRFYDAAEARLFDKFYQKELRALRAKK